MSEALTIVDGEAAGAWIAPRLEGGFGGKVKQQVPDGYDAYVRILHPAGDGQGEPISWAAVAEKLGRTAHREMQWHRLVGISDPLDRWGSEWKGTEPSVGEMDPVVLEALCGILATHTTDSEDCFFGLNTIRGGVEEAYPGAVQLHRPGDFVVFSGPVSAAGGVGYDSGESWVTDIYSDGRREQRLLPSRWLSCSPNLIWPADHSWYVVSNVDFDSTLVGADRELIDAILAAPTLESWEVRRNDSLEAWADKINR